MAASGYCRVSRDSQIGSDVKVGKIILWLFVTTVVAFSLSPLLAVMLMSFSENRIQSLPIVGLTMKWYVDAISSSDLRSAFVNSVQIACLTAVASAFLGFASAHLVVRRIRTGTLWYGVAVSIPCLIPLLVSGFALLIYYRYLGLSGTKTGIIIAHTCFASPFAFAVIRNGYLHLNQELEHAARNLGASRLQIIVTVVVPQLAPSLVGGAMIAFLLSWDEFVLAWFIGGFHKTIPTAIYGALGTAYTPSINAASTLSMSVSLLVVVLLLMAIRRSNACSQ